MVNDDHVTCACCSNEVHWLAVFPGGICVDCYEKTPAARAVLSGEQIVTMFTDSVNNEEAGA